MSSAIQIDASGRLVLPKSVRERLNLRAGTRLRAEIVSGHVQLTPIGDIKPPALKKKNGLTVLARTGISSDAAAAVTEERELQAQRALRR